MYGEIYHVRDPELWKLIASGDTPSIDSTPRLGEQRLDILVGKKKARRGVTVSGGMVAGLELINRNRAVNIRIQGAPRQLFCTVSKEVVTVGGGGHDLLQLQLYSKARDHGGALSVHWVYSWDEAPKEVSVQISDETPAAEGLGYSSRFWSGNLALQWLKSMLRNQRLPRDKETSRIALPVFRWTDAPKRDELHGPLLLPKEVRAAAVFRAAEELCRFASFLK